MIRKLTQEGVDYFSQFHEGVIYVGMNIKFKYPDKCYFPNNELWYGSSPEFFEDDLEAKLTKLLD